MSEEMLFAAPTTPTQTCQRCGTSSSLDDASRACTCEIALGAWTREPVFCGACRGALANVVQEFLGEASRCSS